jgi:tRNA nucleotidyltransferase (CCA-adding enzyme)
MKIRAESLNKRLDQRLKDALFKFSAIADSLDIKLYIVGGILRDLILNKSSYDLDLLLDSGLDIFIDSIQRELGLEVKESSFLTAKVIFQGLTIDIAQARGEKYQSDGSLPQVYPSDIVTDARRRDFTINSLMARVYQGDIVELLDYSGGFDDIKKRLIRVIKRSSFFEDPTRIIRALRYRARFGFKIEQVTLNELKEALKAGVYNSLSSQRLGAELLRVFKESRVSQPLIELFKLDALGFLPDIRLSSAVKKSLKAWDSFKEKERFKDYFIVPLNILFHELPSESLDRVFEIFELTKYQRKIMVEFKELDKERLFAALSKSLKKVDIYDRLKDLDTYSLLSLYSFSCSKRVKDNIIFYIENISKIKLDITGDDVKNLGFAESAQIGGILKSILRRKISGALKSREDQIGALEELLREP